MIRRLALCASVAMLVAATLVGCVRSADSNSDQVGIGGTKSVDISMTEMEFDPASITVPAGAEVTVHLKNVGVVPHDFTIDEVAGKAVKQLVEPGKTESVTFTVPAQPGQVDFYCSQPGHREVGMQGTIIIE